VSSPTPRSLQSKRSGSISTRWPKSPIRASTHAAPAQRLAYHHSDTLGPPPIHSMARGRRARARASRRHALPADRGEVRITSELEGADRQHDRPSRRCRGHARRLIAAQHHEAEPPTAWRARRPSDTAAVADNPYLDCRPGDVPNITSRTESPSCSHATAGTRAVSATVPGFTRRLASACLSVFGMRDSIFLGRPARSGRDSGSSSSACGAQPATWSRRHAPLDPAP